MTVCSCSGDGQRRRSDPSDRGAMAAMPRCADTLRPCSIDVRRAGLFERIAGRDGCGTSRKKI
jgi:hypothetical protein